jgi:hypothetical protein
MLLLRLLSLLDLPKKDIKQLAHLKRRLKCTNRFLSFLGVSKENRKQWSRLRMRMRFVRSFQERVLRFLEKLESQIIRFFEKHGVVKFLEKHWFFREVNDGIQMEGVDQILSLFQPLNWKEVRVAARIALLLLIFVVPPVILLIDWYVVILW